MRRVALLIPLVALVAVAGLVYQPAPVVAQVPEATQTPWVIVITVTEQAPTITPAPAVIIILLTPTPNRVPPSLYIPELPGLLQTGSSAIMSESPIPAVVDETIVIFLEWLIDRQVEYRDLTGRYAQMYPSHSIPPADGVGAYPDGWYTHPTDQDFSWDSFNAIRYEPMPVSIRIDTYNGPEGLGFVACFDLSVAGDTWSRCVNYGPEASRAHGWQLVAEPAP